MIKAFPILFASFALQAAEFRFPPTPPAPVKVALTNLQSAIRVIVAVDVATAIQASGNHAEPVAYHFRAIADVFKAMLIDGTFNVEHLDGNLSRLLPPPEANVNWARSTICTLYASAYEHRGRADVPPLEYLTGISKAFESAIRDGITKAGKANVIQ